MEVRELLDKYEYCGDDAKIVMGSALEALNGTDSPLGVPKVKELLSLMDENIPVPERDADKPFMMSIEGTFHIGGRGTVATGTVDTGKIKAGEDVEIVGY